jgi:isoquinoline 1-oxidoreductase beta subunit
MLISAAARTWNVPAGEITVAKGIVSHPSGKRATFGELATQASKEPVPAAVTLKTPDDWTLIGRSELRRFDSRDKTTGQQQYTIDVRLPGMLIAVIAHPPLFGATVKTVDATAAKQVKGVVDIVPISRGVAVIGETTWAALRGREALNVAWDESKAETRGSAEIEADWRRLLDQPGDATAARRGDPTAALQRAARVIEATYVFPYLAHAALEPLDAVVARRGDLIEVWGGHQLPDVYQMVTAKLAGVPTDRVRLHVMKTGGGFGRRAVPDADIVVEAVETAKAIGWRAPVKLMWTREDDMRAGRYRPLVMHRVRVGLTADGRISGWEHRVVGQSILIGTPFEAMLVKDGVDATSVEGASNMPYEVADFRLDVTNGQSAIPVLWWRSVGHTHTAYVVETMIDEIAAATRQDPVALRRALLAGHPKQRAVLDLAAEKAGWGTPLPTGRSRGIALHESFGSTVAEVAEVTTDARGGFRVDRVVCAIDCGVAINPDQIRSQMEGGIGFGLGAALREAVTLIRGRVESGNYDTYLPLRYDEMPQVEVHIVPSREPPTGVGEPGVPPIAPAVGNAIAAATGKRVRILPFARGLTA